MTIVFAFPGEGERARAIAEGIGAIEGTVALHRFPDGETKVTLDGPVAGHHVVLVCELSNADTKLLPLCFAADAARALGVTSVGLVAPYLAYLRQDARFAAGEAITSITFASILSRYVDWIVTVDPHLHRYGSLSAVYTCSTHVVHAAPVIAEWIRAHVYRPFLLGPDHESRQWVEHVASLADAPWAVVDKVRQGDARVDISVANLSVPRGHTPVLVDDIIATARTMIEAARLLLQRSTAPPVCVGVHAVFAGRAYAELKAAGVADIVTCNTIAHESNRIDVTQPIVGVVSDYLRGNAATP